MNSTIFKKIAIILLALLGLIQFVQPARNEGTVSGPNDINKSIAVPESVQQTLEKSCTDCHSNHTVYPWYANIQPVGFFLKDHVDEGKRELNFSEFNTYKAKRKAHKMEEIVEMLEENEMPLFSYTLIHRNAILSESQKAELMAWAKESQKVFKEAMAAESAVKDEEKKDKEEH